MKALQRIIGVACVAILILYQLTSAKALDATLQSDAIAEYQQLYGYSQFPNDFQPKGSLDYEGFSGQSALDRGLKDKSIYALYGHVKAQHLADYLLYLQRFGYSIEIDWSSACGRYIEVDGEHMTLCLPEHFTIDYYEADGILITILPMSSLSATAALVSNRAQSFQLELGQTKPLTDLLRIQLTASYGTPDCAITPPTPPYCALALPGQNEGMLSMPLASETAKGQKPAMVFHGLEDSLHNTAPLCLLRVTILNDGEPLALSDLEFCLGQNDLNVVYPLQMGTELRDQGNTPVLDTNLPVTVGKEQSLWLLFPTINPSQNAQWRLYVSFAKKHTPLLERVSFGLSLSAM